MSARKRPAIADLPARVSPADRAQLSRQLVQCTTNTGIVQALSALHRAGVLRDDHVDFKPRQLAKELTAAKKIHSLQMTPYGRVVQTIDLPTQRMPKWQICNPLAFMYYLSMLAAPFFLVMQEAVAAAPRGILNVILYIDEVCPGNPLRHDKGRTIQALYWAFAEWPAWLLARSGAWIVFGFLRTAIAKELPGYISQLMKLVLLEFFPHNKSETFEVGIIITCNHKVPFTLRARFGGFLGDEKALKEIFDCMGASGTLPCMKCGNCLSLKNRPYLVPGVVCIDCTDRRLFHSNTNDSIFAIVDALSTLNGKQLEDRQTADGFNRNDERILRSAYLREQGIIQPVRNYIEDWMHGFVSGGQANTHTGLLLNTLKGVGIKPSLVYDHVKQYTIPSRYGKVNPEWLKQKRLDTKDKSSFASYAGTMLSLVPLIFAFLVDDVMSSPHVGDLVEHIRCFGLLASILSLLERPDDIMQNVEKLKDLIDEYGVLFIALYDRAKAKFHHMYHTHEAIMEFKRLLSCFVTERKHRAAKKAAVHVFRYIETTVLNALVNRMCEQFISDASLFKPFFLVSPKIKMIHGKQLSTSEKAVLSIGGTNKGDVVFGVKPIAFAGQVVRFYEFDSRIIVLIKKYQQCHAGDNRYWSTQSPQDVFVHAGEIIDAVAWRCEAANVLRIIPPFIS